MDITGITRIAYETARRYRMSSGITAGPAWESAPDIIKDAHREATKAIVEQDAPSDRAHAVWASTMLAAGWGCGPDRSTLLRTDPALTDYSRLSQADRIAADLIVSTVKLVHPAFQHLAHVSEQMTLERQMALDEQTGALRYMTAIVHKVCGTDRILELTEADMIAGLTHSLERADTEDNGVRLQVEPVN